MLFDQFKDQMPDIDPRETQEWLDSLDAVLAAGGRNRAHYLVYRLLKRASDLGVGLPRTVQTPYINTIPPENEPYFPGDEALERRIRRLIRWNAVAMVTRANHDHPGIGGHLSTYASSATLYEVGFNHFFQGKTASSVGDQVFYQGHGAPGIYARAFLTGQITEEQLDHFRREIFGRGLSSYPHPRLMPDFWEFPTVSMGLGPFNAVYQARFNKYHHARGLADTSRSHVWAFLGDGEMDEPEAIAGLSLAAREGLDNLIFVVNCNLQRLDGPVRGNGKIIQELEAIFRGAGWNVIKVVWGREWDELLARDVDGVLLQRMNETLDGDFQRFAIEDGAHIREHFFGGDPRLRKLVEHLNDDQVERLRRGGHDYRKVYAAYKLATETHGVPTVVLAKTVKGWTLGDLAEGRNVTHQIKKLGPDELRVFRDRLELPIPDDKLAEAPYYHPGPESEEVQYLLERRRQLGGPLPRRVVRPVEVRLPGDDLYEEFRRGTVGSTVQVSTAMGFVRLMRKLMKDPEVGRRIVPIIPDEGRTFGIESLFREFRIYSALGQRYKPVDYGVLLSYAEAKDGQILEEGITEAGSMAMFTAAGTSYATHRQPMIPFFIFYSMFGFQRIGDLIWAFADARGRGFLLGGTAGRTTLNGEGLQHEDGHSILLASSNPACLVYDPAWAYEVAAIVQEGIARMYERNEDVFYYVTLYNENFEMPAMPEGVGEGILRGLYLYRRAPEERPLRAQLLGSGTILSQALRAQEILQRFGVAADVWSATSYVELRREALECERWNRLHPDRRARVPYVTQLLDGTEGPVVAASDFMKAVPDMVGRWIPRDYVVLGTDGFGRSDTREALRRFFEVDAEHIAVAALSALERSRRVPAEVVLGAMKEFGIDPEAPGATPRG